MDGQRIKVLWVDDDPSLVKPYTNEAYEFGIELIHYECWDEAESALESKFREFGAIILDAKCKHHKDSNAKADKFLTESIISITMICQQKKSQIPWYILTAGGAEVGYIDDNIPDYRKEWDRDWDERKHRNYYLKTEDRETLYSRIKYHAIRMSPITQIRVVLYPDIFNAIKQCKISNDIEVLLEDILLPMHFNNDTDEKHLFYAIRKCLEYIFRSLIEEWGILPDVLFRQSENEKINLTAASHLLAKHNQIIDNKTCEPQAYIADKITAEEIKNTVYITGSYLHTEGNSREYKDYKTAKHMRMVMNAPYIIRALVYDICDIIVWMKNYTETHPYYEENKKLIIISTPSV